MQEDTKCFLKMIMNDESLESFVCHRLGAIILFCSSIDYLLSDSLVYLKNVKNKSLKFPR